MQCLVTSKTGLLIEDLKFPVPVCHGGLCFRVCFKF